MQQAEEQAATASQPTILGRLAVPMAVLAGSIVVLLLADVRLSEWAEVSAVHHAMQHVLIFLAGIGVGSSGLQAVRTARHR